VSVKGVIECPPVPFLGQVSLTDDLGANPNAEKPPGSGVGEGKGIQATTYAMLTFHEFLAKKAMVLPNLFRIEPFIGLAQPIPLKATPTPRRRFRRAKIGRLFSP
jgi:hypothetical protein